MFDFKIGSDLGLSTVYFYCFLYTIMEQLLELKKYYDQLFIQFFRVYTQILDTSWGGTLSVIVRISTTTWLSTQGILKWRPKMIKEWKSNLFFNSLYLCILIDELKLVFVICYI